MFARLSFIALTVVAAISVCQGFAIISTRDLPANCARNYTVSSGDTCDAISAAQDSSTFQLALANKATIDPLCDNLFPGEVICLGLTGQDCTTVYEVVSGDSCATIAQGADIQVATLLANNRNVDNACDNIYPDEVLCVASDIIPYSS
ncbi:hypothetical protein BC835DRAFT_1412046 [Cytidiella melzeri]|nr:hypothetical protein BC835DRAFT_1412046 [Cytidiella melzeri]